MIRRTILVVFVLFMLGLVWIVAIAGVTLAIFKKRHPDRCISYSSETSETKITHWRCK